MSPDAEALHQPGMYVRTVIHHVFFSVDYEELQLLMLIFPPERHSFVQEGIKCLHSQETAESDSGVRARSY